MKKQNFENREEVFNYNRNVLIKLGLKEIQKRIGEKFFDMDDIVKAIYVAIISGKNIILWGPGGFGKSEVVIEFMEQTKLENSSIIGYEDMDVEGLLGLPNMSKLMNDSIYELAFENTVFRNPGVLILEEFLDVNPKTAMALKDILSSGGLRQGNTIIESLISSVIICSNRSPYELSTDSSTTAFYQERFPIVKNVEWIDFSASRYCEFIKKVVKDKEYEDKKLTWEVLGELSYRTYKCAQPVSPRIVKDAIHMLQHNGYKLETLLLVDGLETNLLNESIIACEVRDESTKVMQICSNVNRVITQILEESNASTRFIMDSISKLNYINEKFGEVYVTEENSIAVLNECIEKCKTVSEALWNRLSLGSKTKDKDSINQLFEV